MSEENTIQEQSLESISPELLQTEYVAIPCPEHSCIVNTTDVTGDANNGIESLPRGSSVFSQFDVSELDSLPRRSSIFSQFEVSESSCDASVVDQSSASQQEQTSLAISERTSPCEAERQVDGDGVASPTIETARESLSMQSTTSGAQTDEVSYVRATKMLGPSLTSSARSYLGAGVSLRGHLTASEPRSTTITPDHETTVTDFVGYSDTSPRCEELRPQEAVDSHMHRTQLSSTPISIGRSGRLRLSPPENESGVETSKRSMKPFRRASIELNVQNSTTWSIKRIKKKEKSFVNIMTLPSEDLPQNASRALRYVEIPKHVTFYSVPWAQIMFGGLILVSGSIFIILGAAGKMDSAILNDNGVAEWWVLLLAACVTMLGLIIIMSTSVQHVLFDIRFESITIGSFRVGGCKLCCRRTDVQRSLKDLSSVDIVEIESVDYDDVRFHLRLSFSDGGKIHTLEAPNLEAASHNKLRILKWLRLIEHRAVSNYRVDSNDEEFSESELSPVVDLTGTIERPRNSKHGKSKNTINDQPSAMIPKPADI